MLWSESGRWSFLLALLPLPQGRQAPDSPAQAAVFPALMRVCSFGNLPNNRSRHHCISQRQHPALIGVAAASKTDVKGVFLVVVRKVSHFGASDVVICRRRTTPQLQDKHFRHHHGTLSRLISPFRAFDKSLTETVPSRFSEVLKSICFLFPKPGDFSCRFLHAEERA